MPFTAAFLAESKRGISSPGAPALYARLEIGAPLNWTLTASGSDGSMPFIRAWRSSPRFGFDLGAFALSSSQCSVALVEPAAATDPQRYFISKALEKFKFKARRAAVTVKIASPGLASADWFTWYKGILSDWERTGPLEWTLHFEQDALQLQKGFVAKVAITKADWPNADPGAVGQRWPVIYGIHSSSATTARGQVPTIKVDITNHLYGVGIGRCTVQAAYKIVADVVTTLTLTTDYTVVYKTVSGTLVTLIDLVSAPAAGTVIRADVTGFTFNSDGSGGTIKDPVAQLTHLLNNFVYRDWRGGAFFTGTAPINSATFSVVAAYLTKQAAEGSLYLAGTGETTISTPEIISSFLNTWGVWAYWDHAGTLALAVLDQDRRTLFSDSLWWHVQPDGGSPLTIAYGGGTTAVREVTISHIFAAADNDYQNTVTVVDATTPEDATVNVQMRWSAAHG